MSLGQYGIVQVQTAPLYDSFDVNAHIVGWANDGEKLALHGKVDHMRLVVKLSDNTKGWMREANFKAVKRPSQPAPSHLTDCLKP